MISGEHLIAGVWQRGAQTFRSDPYQGVGREYSEGTAADVEQAALQADAAFEWFANTSAEQRAEFLHALALDIDANKQQILTLCGEETGLQPDRLAGEFTRTVNQIEYFAQAISTPDYLDLRHDEALPHRAPLPRPELRLKQRPVGPVAVFGASNFPLAFSTAGGDTISALAVGCPVIVKAHAAHPGTSELVARCIARQIEAMGMHPGIFSQIQNSHFEVGQSLVQNARVKAVGFTGSLAGGRALYDLCVARAEPIPFFGELGSVNPVFVLPDALAVNPDSLAQQWVGSLTVGAGQLCTNPGITLVVASDSAERFIAAASAAMSGLGEQVLLGDNIAAAYRKGHEQLRDHPQTSSLISSHCSRRSVTPGLFKTSAQALLSNDFMAEEVFGPLGVVVVAESVSEFYTVAKSLVGQLTCTIHTSDTGTDQAQARQLLSIVEHKAGRVIFNGFPTGVEVCDSMVHGGPYPASTNFGATSVGSLSMRRFLRPVCYQNVPQWV
ncbi:MAG: aldehyde dehydrogenase (NADP(+)) [Pseudomonadota bacterium]